MTRLRQALRSRNELLWQQVESLVARATPQLWHTWSTFPTGTKHTPEHTQKVEAIASLLLPDEVVAQLQDDEIAMLILACHYHDLGMAGTETDNATGEGRDRVRSQHAISIGERIRERWQELGFENQNYAEILAEVCRGHRPEKVDGVANWDNLPLHRNVAPPDRFVRLRLVSAMIYASDELHLGDDRAPKREEDWKEITSAESLKHWRRHQAVSGPTRPLTAITFDIRINTLSFEVDIRKVFKKAFRAVADLRRELSSVGITHPLSQLEVQWLREDLWKLLIIKVCSDGAFRSRDKINDLVLAEFKSGESRFEDLVDLCCEQPNTDRLLSDQIKRAVGDFVTCQFLVPGADPVTLCLASDYRAVHYLFGLTGSADECERLFARAIDADHEQRLYESETGKRFIRAYIFQEIKTSYAVDVATMPDTSSLRTVIESSPTACKFVQQISTPPGTLVKRDLLLVAVTAGICFDLMNNPGLFLDKALRAAIRDLFSGTANRLPRFMNLIQELAIIKDLSFEQVTEIMIPSESVRNELTRAEGEGFSVHLMQQFPSERPEWALPYLLLAGRRAQEPISILNGQAAPFRISVDSDHEGSARLNQEQPVMVSITPQIGDVTSVVSLRASVSFDPSNRLLVFSCHRLTREQDHLPVIITIPSKEPDAALVTAFSFVSTAMNVGQLLDLQRASEFSKSGTLEVRLDVDGVGQLGRMVHNSANPFSVPELIPTDSLVALAQCDRQLPIPMITFDDLPERLINAEPANRASEFEAVKSLIAQQKPSVTSVFVRFASVTGQVFREEYLGFLPLGMSFAAPEVSGGSMTQAEVDEKCSKGDWMLTTIYREDCYKLAEEIRKWVKDPTQDFPFRSDNDLKFHYCKTRLELEHRLHIDRFWYVERPAVFTFCAVTKAEQYRVELEYWKSLNDTRRVELLAELIELEEKAESIEFPVPSRSAPDPEAPPRSPVSGTTGGDTGGE